LITWLSVLVVAVDLVVVEPEVFFRAQITKSTQALTM
jgi:hypothetical protein